MAETAVVNASPIIYVARAKHFELLHLSATFDFREPLPPAAGDIMGA